MTINEMVEIITDKIDLLEKKVALLEKKLRIVANYADRSGGLGLSSLDIELAQIEANE